ncbi:MAG: hypothetical protein KR126chlam3_01699 [Chlamydiae bacterium]|nr:hypothetical protein [Chlamydiota bacterium]
MKNLCFLFVLLFLFSQEQIFGLSFDQQNTDQQISQTIYLTHGIISCSPEIIKWKDGDKIYIKEEFVAKQKDDGLGGVIHIDSENQLFLPLILSDEYGYFTSVSRDFWDKPFHQICNKCQFEWEGGVFATRCPSCGSRDISNIPSR